MTRCRLNLDIRRLKGASTRANINPKDGLVCVVKIKLKQSIDGKRIQRAKSSTLDGNFQFNSHVEFVVDLVRLPLFQDSIDRIAIKLQRNVWTERHLGKAELALEKLPGLGEAKTISIPLKGIGAELELYAVAQVQGARSSADESRSKFLDELRMLATFEEDEEFMKTNEYKAEKDKLDEKDKEKRDERTKTLQRKGSVAGGLSHDLEDDYAVGVVLGEGGFGLVRRGKALHESEKIPAGTDVAIKYIQKDSHKPNSKERTYVRREISILRRLHHPNILRLYDVYESPKDIILVLELLEGGNLLERLREESQYPESLVIRIVKQVVAAVAHMHELGIVHRDLKLENLMLDSKGADALVKVVDFGLATKMEDRTKGKLYRLKSMVGTPGFVAPEVLTPQLGSYDAAVDVFSIGVLTYQMICGRLPFAVPSNLEKLHESIIRQELKFGKRAWATISSECKDFITDCLQKDPKARPTSAQILAYPWLQLKQMKPKLSADPLSPRFDRTAKTAKSANVPESSEDLPAQIPTRGTLAVTIVEGRNLKAMDRNGKSDPYCIVTIGAQTFKTAVVRKSLTPLWNANFSFDVSNILFAAFNLECWDRDHMSRDDLMGRTSLPLAFLTETPNKDVPLELEDGQIILVKFIWHPAVSKEW